MLRLRWAGIRTTLRFMVTYIIWMLQAKCVTYLRYCIWNNTWVTVMSLLYGLRWGHVADWHFVEYLWCSVHPVYIHLMLLIPFCKQPQRVRCISPRDKVWQNTRNRRKSTSKWPHFHRKWDTKLGQIITSNFCVVVTVVCMKTVAKGSQVRTGRKRQIGAEMSLWTLQG